MNGGLSLDGQTTQVCNQPTRSTEPYSVSGMVKQVLVMVTAIAREENHKLCARVGPVVRTASLLT